MGTSVVWPRPSTIQAAAAGRVAEVLKTPLGVVRGLRSADPDVYLAIGTYRGGERLAAACCLRCGTAQPAPPPPRGTAGPLVEEDTPERALHLSAWLHEFSRAHAACDEVKTPEQA